MINFGQRRKTVKANIRARCSRIDQRLHELLNEERFAYAPWPIQKDCVVRRLGEIYIIPEEGLYVLIRVHEGLIFWIGAKSHLGLKWISIAQRTLRAAPAFQEYEFDPMRGHLYFPSTPDRHGDII